MTLTRKDFSFPTPNITLDLIVFRVVGKDVGIPHSDEVGALVNFADGIFEGIINGIPSGKSVGCDGLEGVIVGNYIGTFVGFLMAS